MKITNFKVAGLEEAVYSMRHPMNSWSKSDSKYLNCAGTPDYNTYIIGENDMGLAQRLINGGSEHCKFLRQIQVWADMDLPRYIWSEFDTYKFNTKNSTSTMHRLLNNPKPITLDLFLIAEEDLDIYTVVISRLEELRQEYLQTKDIKLLVRAKRLLPEGFLQLRMVNTNYAELRNIYFQRRHHRLKEEWGVVMKWIESLPYAKELIMYEGK